VAVAAGGPVSRARPQDQRRTGDSYYTPDPLAEALVCQLLIDPGASVVEPSVGGGAFARAIRGHEPSCSLVGVDVNAEAAGFEICDDGVQGDFLGCGEADIGRPDWIIGNPPFGDAEAHVRHALEMVNHRGGVAFLLRLAFLESAGRLGFWKGPGACLRKVYVLSQRPSFTGGQTDSAAYGFFHWRPRYDGPSELEVLDWHNARQPELFS
jgi:hypothetical protein